MRALYELITETPTYAEPLYYRPPYRGSHGFWHNVKTGFRLVVLLFALSAAYTFGLLDSPHGFMYRTCLNSKTKKGHDSSEAARYCLNGAVQSASKKYNVRRELIWAIIKVESNFDHRAVSPKGAKGLMQLMPATANDMGLKNPFDPYRNVEAGSRYLGILLKRYGGDITKAIAAYNAGMAHVDRYKGVPPFKETQNYVSMVKDAYYGRKVIRR